MRPLNVRPFSPSPTCPCLPVLSCLTALLSLPSSHCPPLTALLNRSLRNVPWILGDATFSYAFAIFNQRDAAGNYQQRMCIFGGCFDVGTKLIKSSEKQDKIVGNTAAAGMAGAMVFSLAAKFLGFNMNYKTETEGPKKSDRESRCRKHNLPRYCRDSDIIKKKCKALEVGAYVSSAPAKEGVGQSAEDAKAIIPAGNTERLAALFS